MSKVSYKDLVQDCQDYINDNIKAKYLLQDEHNWNDLIERFKKILFPSMLITNPNIEKYEIERRFNKIIEMIKNKRHLPAGSILFGLGNNEVKCSLSNCYFIPIKEDSIEGIFDCCKEMARTYSWRGGVGINISILRPKNCKVNNSARYSTGSTSFMELFNTVTAIIGQSGDAKKEVYTRRGALIIIQDIRHPDTLDIIWSKSRPEKVFLPDKFTGRLPDISNANISIKLNKSFMDAVKADKDWTFIFPDTSYDKYDSEWNGDFDEWISKGYPTVEYNTMRARDVLMEISESAWTTGDPGIVYWDHIMDYTPTSFDKKLKPEGLNPC